MCVTVHALVWVRAHACWGARVLVQLCACLCVCAYVYVCFWSLGIDKLDVINHSQRFDCPPSLLLTLFLT